MHRAGPEQRYGRAWELRGPTDCAGELRAVTCGGGTNPTPFCLDLLVAAGMHCLANSYAMPLVRTLRTSVLASSGSSPAADWGDAVAVAALVMPIVASFDPLHVSAHVSVAVIANGSAWAYVFKVSCAGKGGGRRGGAFQQHRDIPCASEKRGDSPQVLESRVLS